MDSIVILDDDEEDPQPCPSTSSSCTATKKDAPKASRPTPTPTHITQSPFASSQKEGHILLLENQRLFAEFLDHCATHTKDCPEVMTFLKAKHSKASPEYLSSVEFRNTLGRCLTRAQSSRAKTFVYINELCTVLKQHTAKKRQTVVMLPPAPAGQEPRGPTQPDKEEHPSTSGQEEEKRKANRASRRQLAYLENLLKVYYDEIRRLQEKELSLDDLKEEDSGYIQEHKLKRKMMKIYDKLCELKGCSTLTGRVIEQKVQYSGTRYPEINRKVERFINSSEAQLNPPDYSDILRAVQRANDRSALSLSRKQLTQIAQEAFRETGNRLQERRHLDMVYNFGSHLTDCYKPACDPALTDSSLARKLRDNREVALSSLEEVISKYALKQDDTEEEERRKRLERDKAKKEKTLAAQKEGEKTEEEVKKEPEEEEGDEECEEEEEEAAAESEGEEDEEDEVSSDTDIEEELEASQSQEGADDEEEETNPSDEEERLGSGGSSGSDGEAESAGENGAEDSQSASSGHGDVATASPAVPRDPTPSASPSQSGATPSVGTDASSSNGGLAQGEPVSTNHVAATQQSTNRKEPSPYEARPSPAAAEDGSSPRSSALDSSRRVSPPLVSESRVASTSPAPPGPAAIKVSPDSKKRKRTSDASTTAFNGHHKRDTESDSDITLDMGVVSSSPLQADSTSEEAVSSSEFTPPPKRNKVNVSTQCDPDEVIVLSDSD